MYRQISLLSAGISLLVATTLAHGQEPATPMPPAVEAKSGTPVGSAAFCLYELPMADEGRRRWLNLGIVQYLEFTRNELKIYYGGGNLGSGHEARISVTNPAQLDETLNKLRQAAANCR